MAKDIISRPLTTKEFDELKKAKKDPFFFSKFIRVVHPIRGKVPFNLYPYQMTVLWYFLTKRFNIILKFRQAGITELISMYCLWLAMFHPNKNIVIISIKDRVAKKVLRKIKYMYKHLPDHMKIPIVNGRTGEYGTACITGDTQIIGENNNFRIDSIAPPFKGEADVSHLNLKVLTHEKKFQRILKTINKGTLDTWEIRNNKGQVLKCTPDHRLYTIKGWKTTREVVENNLDAIFIDTDQLTQLEQAPKTIPPEKEIIKETYYPGYYVSNLGKVYSKRRSGKLKLLHQRTGTHCRIKLRAVGKWFSVHRLVWETFEGNIPDGYVVDHINCNRFDNYITNLQCITYSENTKRAYKYNRSMKITNSANKPGLSLKDIGKLRVWDEILDNEYGSNKMISKELGISSKKASQLRRQKNLGSVYISKLEKIREFEETIYDMEVEEDHSYITASHYVNHNTDMEFSNGSQISSVPTTEDAGRSEAVSLLVIDEAAIVRWANQIWAAAFPTLSTGGASIVNSTPYGVGNWYHQSWVDSISGGNDFNPIRLRWEMHPERDQAWYNQMAESLGKRRTAQEIDGDFLTSGHSVFDLNDIKAIEDCLLETKVVESRYNGQLKMFEKPKKNRHYYIGADVATGRAQDYSAFTIMDRFGEEVGCFKGKISVDRFADLLMEYGHKYNDAVLAPEANDIGLAVVSRIQSADYPNLYYSEKMLRKKGKKRVETESVPGWLTTSKTRPVIIDELEEDIRNEDVIINDPFFVQEAYTFIYDASNRPVAMGKNRKGKGDQEDDALVYSDDAIMGKAIANYIRKGKVKTGIVPPQ
jgi:hypothetical protein